MSIRFQRRCARANRASDINSRRCRNLLTWYAIIIAVGCGPAENDRSASDASLARRRIVSLSFSVSELLVELGAGFEIVAADSASRALPGLGAVVDLGELALTAVGDAVASRPDLVVGLATPRARDFAAALEQRGVVVHLFDPHDANAVIRVTHRLGDLLDRPTRAISVASARIQAVSQLAGLRDGSTRWTAVWLVGCDPLSAIGGSGLVHEILELAGAENGFHMLGFAQVEITHEQLAAQNPEVVLDSTGADGLPRCFDFGSHTPRIEATPAELASVPGIDLARRVRAIQELIYGTTQQVGE